MRWAALVLLAGCSDGKASLPGGPLDPPVRGDLDPMLPSGPSGGAMGQSCRGWECGIVDCESTPPTILSGVVRDPGGNLPIAGALVYVPNQKETAFAAGCRCEADSPVAQTLTDAQGRFHLANAPAGSKVPVVIQIGKWRRRVFVPVVKSCADNPVDADLTRLPRNQAEGSIPKIALTTGCDRLESFAAAVGIDSAEITGPSGTGRVHVYRGNDDGQTLPDSPGNADVLFGDAKLLQSYDMVLASSECVPFAHSVTAMGTYLQSGGTLLASGSQVGLFASKFQTMADWISATPEPAPYTIDVKTPSAKMLSDWAKAAKLTADGTVTLVGAGGRLGATKYGGTRLVESATQTQLATFRFSPYTACGRVSYADFEVAGRAGEGRVPMSIDDAHRTSAALFQSTLLDWTCDWMPQQMPIPE